MGTIPNGIDTAQNEYCTTDYRVWAVSYTRRDVKYGSMYCTVSGFHIIPQWTCETADEGVCLSVSPHLSGTEKSSISPEEEEARYYSIVVSFVSDLSHK